MSNIKTNPYEENTAVLNSFFKKPLVLVVAILNVLICVGVIAWAGLTTLLGWQVCIAALIPLVLQYLAYLLFFVRARRKSGLKSAVAVFRANGIYSLVLTSLSIGLLGYHWGETIYRALMYKYPISVSLLVISVVVLGVSLTYSITKLKLANSFAKSMKSIYLNNNGATAYGVCNLLFGLFVVITGVFYAFVMLVNFSSPFYLGDGAVLIIACVLIVLTAVELIMESVLAFKYANFVNKMSSNFVVVPQVEEDENPFEGIEGITPVVNDVMCTGCGKELNPADAFCPACGTAVKK